MDAKTPAIDALLVHRPFLAGLARSLLRDDAAAEDVVQETYLRAVEHPPEERGRTRGWLATVTRNLVRERGRREPKVRAWEARAARPEGSVPSPDEIAEREAVRRAVVEALLALDEASRDVLLLRFYEDLPPRTIARELGLPVETVRTRIKRGLTKLRARLDDGHGGARRAWALALLPLAFPRQASASPLARVFSHAGQAGAPVTALKAGLVATVVLVLLTWWSPWSGDGGQAPASDGAADEVADLLVDPPAADATDGPLAVVGGMAPSAPGETTALVPVAAAVPPQLTGVVHRASDGAPAPGLPVFLAGIELDDWAELLTPEGDAPTRPWTVHRATTDGDGRFGLQGLPQGTWFLGTPGDADTPLGLHALVLVGADAVVHAAVWAGVRQRASRFDVPVLPVHSVALGNPLELDVRLAPRAPSVDVLVTDDRGRPVAGAELLHLSPTARLLVDEVFRGDRALETLAGLSLRVTVDGNGRASLPVGPGAPGTGQGGAIVARADGFGAREVEVPGADVDGPLRIALLAASTLQVTGRAVDDAGRPLAGLDVWLTPDANPFLPVDELAALLEEHDRPRVTTGADGRFVFEPLDRLSDATWRPDALTADTPLLVTALREGHVRAIESVGRFRGDPVVDVELVLRRGGVLEVEVHDETTGRPFGGIVTVRPERGGAHSNFAAEDGLYGWSDMAFGPLEIDLMTLGKPAQTHALDWSGGRVELVFEDRRPAWPVAVRLEDVSGREVDLLLPTAFGERFAQQPIVVVAYPADPTHVLAAGRSVAGPPRPPGTSGGMHQDRDLWHLALDDDWPTDEAWVVAWVAGRPLAVRHIARGTEAVTLEVDLDAVLAEVGFLSLAVRDAVTGDVLYATASLLDPVSGDVVEMLHTQTGTALVGEVDRPGTYDVRVVSSGHAVALLEGVTVEAGRRTGPIEVPMRREVRLELDLARPDGGDEPVFVRLFDERGRYLAGTGSDERRVDLGWMAPGRHWVHATTRTGAVAAAWVDIGERGTTRVELPLQPAGALSVGLDAGRAATWTGGELRLWDERGRLLLDFDLGAEDAAALVDAPRRYGLRPGRYRVETLALGSPTVERWVTVGDDDVALRLE